MSVRTLDELVDEIKKEFGTAPSECINSVGYPTRSTPLAVHRSIQHDNVKSLIKDWLEKNVNGFIAKKVL